MDTPDANCTLGENTPLILSRFSGKNVAEMSNSPSPGPGIPCCDTGGCCPLSKATPCGSNADGKVQLTVSPAFTVTTFGKKPISVELPLAGAGLAPRSPPV